MPVAEEQTNVLATAAAAAATGAAVYGLRKALSSNGAPAMLRHGEDSDDGDDGDDGETGEGGVHSLLASVWDSLEGSLSPIADQAAQAAGRWAAENSPEFVRARIPSFIEAFEDAQ
jgi:hypothetical protein